MPKLIRGDQLSAAARREVLRVFIYRWTVDNKQRKQAYQNVINPPTVPLETDEQWLRSHAFWCNVDGSLTRNRPHAEPSYLAGEA